MFPEIQVIYDFKGCKTNFKVQILPSNNEMYVPIYMCCVFGISQGKGCATHQA